jgi:thioredoxin-related protein
MLRINLLRHLRYAVYRIILPFLLFSQSASAQDLTKWGMLKDALSHCKLNSTPLLFHFYADSSESCQMMTDSIYSDVGIAGYMRSFVVAVKFNVFSSDTVNYLDKFYIPSGKASEIHPFYSIFKENNDVLPLTVILSDFDVKKNDFKLKIIKSGYLSPREFQPLLVYTAEHVNKNCSLNDFCVAFDNCFYDSSTAEAANKVKWLNPSDGFNMGPMGRKTLVFLYTEFCSSCTVMKRAVFSDPRIREKADAYFKLIEFNTEISDTIYFDNQVSVKSGANHQLAMALLKEDFFIPAISIIDENNMLLTVLKGFIPAHFLVDMLEYYGGDHYKTKSWSDYQKSIH